MVMDGVFINQKRIFCESIDADICNIGMCPFEKYCGIYRNWVDNYELVTVTYCKNIVVKVEEEK